MATSKELLEQGTKDGTLTEEQLKRVTNANIELYAKAHGYNYTKGATKKELIASILASPGKTNISGIEVDAEEVSNPKVVYTIDKFTQIRNLFGTVQGIQSRIAYNPVAKQNLKNHIADLREMLKEYAKTL